MLWRQTQSTPLWSFNLIWRGLGHLISLNTGGRGGALFWCHGWFLRIWLYHGSLKGQKKYRACVRNFIFLHPSLSSIISDFQMTINTIFNRVLVNKGSGRFAFGDKVGKDKIHKILWADKSHTLLLLFISFLHLNTLLWIMLTKVHSSFLAYHVRMVSSPPLKTMHYLIIAVGMYNMHCV